jgi:hypothetical protein
MKAEDQRTIITLSIGLIIVGLTALILHFEGRSLICSCGRILLWAGDIRSADTSQHLSDPYSFTHILHGFLFGWILVPLLPKANVKTQLLCAVTIESIWEIIENSSFVINRYRTETISLGYQGDTIINSLSDITCCGIGFIISRYLGVKKSIILFLLTELFLIFWIKDSLIINIIMLIYPSKTIKEWQMMK